MWVNHQETTKKEDIMTVQNSAHELISIEELRALPKAPQTETYGGYDHDRAYDMALEIATGQGLLLAKERLEITKGGLRAFMQLSFEHALFPDYLFSVGLRSTYDKSASLAIATGPAVTVCNNLCVWGSDVTLFRKHTKYIENDIGDLFESAFEDGRTRIDQRIKWMESLKQTKLTKEQGRMLIGASVFTNVTRHNVATKAMQHWEEPPFEFFKGEQNMFGLQNALTWAAHSERPEKKLEMHKKTSAFIKRVRINENNKLLIAS